MVVARDWLALGIRNHFCREWLCSWYLFSGASDVFSCASFRFDKCCTCFKELYSAPFFGKTTASNLWQGCMCHTFP